MEKDTVLSKEYIYNLVNGYLNIEQPVYMEGLKIENEFEVGKPCERLYGEVFDAKMLLNEKLGIEESPEVELIIDNMMEIARIVSLKMFEYGVSLKENK